MSPSSPPEPEPLTAELRPPAEGIRLERRIETAQAARRTRIREAARALASEGGYAAVTMHDVAERAGVGRATVYRYYSSKDHLIADVHLEQGAAIVDQLSADPPASTSPADRLAELCARIVDVAAADLLLTEAGVALALSDDPAVASAEEWRRTMMLPYLQASFSDDLDTELDDVDTVAEVLQAMLFQALLGLVRGRLDADAAKSMLARTAHLVLDDR